MKYPVLLERGERGDDGGWDYYECPDCGASISTYCDCPECGWYNAHSWKIAVQRTARDHSNIYTPSPTGTEGQA